MRLPKWDEFTTSLSNFENSVNDAIIRFKENHPLLDKSIAKSIPLFPPPFNAVADLIYNSFEGSQEDKSEQVLNYFNYLKNQGQRHYDQIATQLSTILIDIDDVKKIMAKESTVESIKDILISTSKNIESKLSELQKEIQSIQSTVEDNLVVTKKIGGKMDTIMSKLDQMILFQKDVFHSFNYSHLLTPNSTISAFSQLVSKNDLSVLIEKNEEALKLDPDNSNALFNKGMIKYIQMFYVEAITWFDKSLSVKPNDSNVLIKKGLAYGNLINYSAALNCFNQALRVSSESFWAHYNKGIALEHLNKFEMAIVSYDESLRIDPNNVHSLYRKGICFDCIGENKTAIEFFKQALECEPQNVDILYSIAFSLKNSKRYNESKKYLDRVLAIDPDHTNAINDKIYCNKYK